MLHAYTLLCLSGQYVISSEVIARTIQYTTSHSHLHKFQANDVTDGAEKCSAVLLPSKDARADRFAHLLYRIITHRLRRRPLKR
jgi:hypothetical protein